jgi:hypothetical protein
MNNHSVMVLVFRLLLIHPLSKIPKKPAFLRKLISRVTTIKHFLQEVINL